MATFVSRSAATGPTERPVFAEPLGRDQRLDSTKRWGSTKRPGSVKQSRLSEQRNGEERLDGVGRVGFAGPLSFVARLNSVGQLGFVGQPNDGRMVAALLGLAMVLVTSVGCNRLSSLTAPRHQLSDSRPIERVELVPLRTSTTVDEEGSIPPAMTELPSRPTLLHFWATWCPPCRAEYPELDAMVKALGDEKVAFVSVACDGEPGESYQQIVKATNRFFKQLGIESDAYVDPRGTTRMAFAAATQQPDLFLPTTVLLDSDHRILEVWDGYDPDNIAIMRAAVERLQR